MWVTSDDVWLPVLTKTITQAVKKGVNNVRTLNLEQLNGIQPSLILLFTPHLTRAVTCQNVLCDKTSIMAVIFSSECRLWRLPSWSNADDLRTDVSFPYPSVTKTRFSYWNFNFEVWIFSSQGGIKLAMNVSFQIKSNKFYSPPREICIVQL